MTKIRKPRQTPYSSVLGGEHKPTDIVTAKIDRILTVNMSTLTITIIEITPGTVFQYRKNQTVSQIREP